MNNNNVELLIRLIIPALFLLAWALNQVMNKDAKPAPPQRGPLPDPFRNRLPPAKRPAGDPIVERLRDSLTKPPQPSPTLRPGQEFVIVESETRPTRSAPTAPSAPTPSRAGRRNRNPKRSSSGGSSSVGSAPKKGNAQSQNLVGGIGNLATGLTDSPINVPVVPVAGISGSPMDRTDLDTRGPATNPSLLPLQRALGSPERVRQAILLNEILQPPIALRGRRSGARPG